MGTNTSAMAKEQCGDAAAHDAACAYQTWMMCGATASGHLATLRSLCVSPAAVVRICEEYGTTPGHVAATRGKPGCFAILLGANARVPYTRDPDGRTPIYHLLEHAVCKTHAAAGQLKVLEDVANTIPEAFDVPVDTKTQSNALHVAAERRLIDAADLIVCAWPASARAENAKGQTPLDVALQAEEPPCMEVVSSLLLVASPEQLNVALDAAKARGHVKAIAAIEKQQRVHGAMKRLGKKAPHEGVGEAVSKRQKRK